MIFIGDHTTLVDFQTGEPYVKNLLVFNLLSPLEGFERLNIIPTGSFILEEGKEREFDINYANYILQSNGINELMKAMMPFYEGKNIYLLVYRDNGGYFDAIIESVYKFIQHRYGVIPIMINDVEDYNFTPTQYNMSMSVNGLYNFDIDKENYVKYIAKEALHNGVTELPEGRLY
jgi:hypothetical protein